MTDELRCSIEVRADEMSPGRLVGTLLTYNEQARDRRETFAPGALSWPDNGVVLREQHNRQAPIMRVIPEIRGDKVVIDSPLPDTSRGRDMAVMIRNGTFTGLSLEFRATAESFPGGLREIRRAILTGAGLVDLPSYRGSKVEVRHSAGARTGTGRRLWL